MRSVQTLSSVTTSDWIPVNWKQKDFKVGIGVAVTGTNTSKVEVCHENILAGETPVPMDHATMVSMTASEAGAQTTPVTGIRLNCTAYTSGAVTMTVLQGVV